METETIMVFPDIKPLAPVHLLIVPKRHIPELIKLDQFDNPPAGGDQFVWNDVFTVALKLIKQYNLDNKGYRLVINGGGAQAIDHLHLHLMGGVGKQL